MRLTCAPGGWRLSLMRVSSSAYFCSAWLVLSGSRAFTNSWYGCKWRELFTAESLRDLQGRSLSTRQLQPAATLQVRESDMRHGFWQLFSPALWECGDCNASGEHSMCFKSCEYHGFEATSSGNRLVEFLRPRTAFSYARTAPSLA